MSNYNVLIWALDDSEIDLFILKSQLLSYGIDITVFNKHREFYEVLNPDVDIVLIDVNMGHDFEIVDGLRRIYDVKKDMLVILMTGMLDKSLAVGLLQDKSIFRYVQKTVKGECKNVFFKDGVKHQLDAFEAINIYIAQAVDEIQLRQEKKLYLQ